MPILQIKDKDGIFIPIPAIRGKDGKSAYEQAVEGGYIGTEEAFIALLNGLTATEDADHYADFNNPHRVTKEQVGLGNVDNTSDIDKPVSTAQQAAIANVQTNLNAHAADSTHVGKSAGGGAFIGSGSTAQAGGGAVGSNAQSLGLGGFAGGDTALANEGGGAIGYEAAATEGGGAVGCYAKTSWGFAGGYSAITKDDNGAYINAIQLGSGQNKDEGTLQVYGYRMMADNGVIPSERLPIATGDYEGTNKHGATNPLTLTFPFVPKIVFICPNKKTTDVPFAWIYGSPVGLTAYNNGVAYASNLTWEGNTLTWYTADGYPSYQHNNGSTTYYWVAIG